jgi:hypothetical protein
VILGLPPSESLAVAEQYNVVFVVTPEFGEMITGDNTGAVLSTLTLAVPESVPPFESVAVTVQVIESDGDAVELVSARLALVPRVLEPLAHS